MADDIFLLYGVCDRINFALSKKQIPLFASGCDVGYCIVASATRRRLQFGDDHLHLPSVSVSENASRADLTHCTLPGHDSCRGPCSEGSSLTKTILYATKSEWGVLQGLPAELSVLHLLVYLVAVAETGTVSLCWAVEYEWTCCPGHGFTASVCQFWEREVRI